MEDLRQFTFDSHELQTGARALSLWLADASILPLKDSPDRMTRRLLEARILH